MPGREPKACRCGGHVVLNGRSGAINVSCSNAFCGFPGVRVGGVGRRSNVFANMIWELWQAVDWGCVYDPADVAGSSAPVDVVKEFIGSGVVAQGALDGLGVGGPGADPVAKPRRRRSKGGA